MAGSAKEHKIKNWLDAVYDRYHRKEWIGTDPIKFIYRYTNPQDQEIVGLIAASLAYGNVTSINTSISRALERLSDRPGQFVLNASDHDLHDAFIGFRHRWTAGSDMAALLVGVRNVLRNHGSLGAAFVHLDDNRQPLTATLGKWVHLIQSQQPAKGRKLLADPERNSACKRLNLYLRWMVRKDEIDPGCWTGISSKRLQMPLDTHVFRFCRACGFTRRTAADGRTVAEVTAGFRRISPEDPVKYDFSLTRPGIVDGWSPDMNEDWTDSPTGSGTKKNTKKLIKFRLNS